MARRYVMTARRKAALRKAQLASARKRRKGGRIKSTARAYKRETARKKAYAKKHYKGPGAYKRKASDMYHSRGAFSKNWRGRSYSTRGKRINKAATIAVHANYGSAAILAGSHIRGKRAAKKRRRSRR